MKILLFSGGIESTCLAKSWKPDVCFTLDYGQVSAAGEIAASRLISRSLGLDHEVAQINLTDFGAGILAGRKPIPNEKQEFWPFRNQMLITLAAMRFARIPDVQIAVGTIRTDRQHPDGKPAFLKLMRKVLSAQRPDLMLEFPALNMSSEKLVEASNITLSTLGYTFSCHTSPIACGRCPGCRKNLAIRE